MATFKTFEDIEAWQKSRILADKIYRRSREGDFSRDFKLRDQVNGAAGPIMDNIAEGFEREGTREFVQFLSIAKGSAGEVRSQLYRVLDHGYISQESFNELQEEVITISKQISGLMNYLKRSELKGTKFIHEPEEPYQVDPEP